MGCHIIDPAWWVLDLKYPTSVEAQPGPYNNETYPEWTTNHLGIPGRGDLPPVTVTWCDGKNEPPRPKELEAGAGCRTRAASTMVRRGRSSCRTAAIRG